MHLVLKFHRVSRKLHLRGFEFLAYLIYKFMRVFFSCDIKYSVEIGDDVKFYHNALGVVIHPNSIIGKGTAIYQNVTLGGNGKSGSKNNFPIIGNNVTICAGAVILGPVHIGDNSIIGANAVVNKNVKENTTVVGVPAKEIRKNTNDGL
ncbi:serine O-acetyltransferase [Vibrio fluvialis]|nr:serine O-acetyltransferase [Vibrio fluvialis]